MRGFAPHRAGVHNCGVTSQIYYKDPDIYEFSARVESVVEEDGRTVVVLDQTAFYPEGGGQPADQGTLNRRPVVHVRKDPDGIKHILANGSPDIPELAVGDSVTGVVDPAHRRDYMQQHTGQHIISAALLEIGGFNTVSVHLGAEYATIEVDAPAISIEQLAAVESLANSWIEEAIPVTSTVVTDDEIGGYPLRRPPKVSGSIRLVMADTVDCAACGGVHVANTSKVRLVHAIGTEIIRGNLRISWKIGDRAIADYQMTSALVTELGDSLSAQPGEIGERLRQQEERLKEAESTLKRSRERICQIIAGNLIASEQSRGGHRTIAAGFADEDKDFLRGVSKVLVEQTGVAACLVNRLGEQLQWSIVISPEATVEYGDLKDKLFPLIEAKGGGKPPIWQGMGTRPDAAAEFLETFRRLAGRE
jgi:alanyl-tRNA synthetase